MAAERIVLDTSILIDFFRKKNKAKAILFHLSYQYQFCVSVIGVFELLIGIKSEHQQQQYDILMTNVEILPLDQLCIEQAVKIHKHLKRQNAGLGLEDLLIGATSIRHQLPLATLNEKHFVRIPDLKLVDLTLYQR